MVFQKPLPSDLSHILYIYIYTVCFANKTNATSTGTQTNFQILFHFTTSQPQPLWGQKSSVDEAFGARRQANQAAHHPVQWRGAGDTLRCISRDQAYCLAWKTTFGEVFFKDLRHQRHQNPNPVLIFLAARI